MRDFSIDLVWTKVQIAITAIGGWAGYFLGGIDGLMIAQVVLMVLDYISGVMCAIIDRKLSSAVGFKGICKKVLILMLVGVANVIDVHVVGSGSALRGAARLQHPARLTVQHWFASAAPTLQWICRTSTPQMKQLHSCGPGRSWN